MRKKPWLLDLGHLNWLLPSGRDNFSAAENPTAVSAYSRLPPSSCPWARRCCLPSALSFTSFLYFHVSLHPFSSLQILTYCCVFLLLPPHPLCTVLYCLVSPIDLCYVFPYPSEYEGAQPGDSKSDFALCLNPQNASNTIFSKCDQYLYFFFFSLDCCIVPLTYLQFCLLLFIKSPHCIQSELSKY